MSISKKNQRTIVTIHGEPGGTIFCRCQHTERGVAIGMDKQKGWEINK
jgi:hypothetical protein